MSINKPKHWDDVYHCEFSHWTFEKKVRALRAHDELLAALRALVDQIPKSDDGAIAHEWLQARAAIAKAEGV